LAEFVPLCEARGLQRVGVLEFLWDVVKSSSVETIWVDELTHEAAVGLLRARLDKTYSLCDAVSFVLMRRFGIAEALTTDRHFEQEGFHRLLQP
jgi:predicted nucleic acid-binding protein